MKQYALTKEGIEAFTGDILTDVLGNGIYNDISITVGSRNISVMIAPETFEMLEIMLKQSLEIIEEEYNDEI